MSKGSVGTAKKEVARPPLLSVRSLVAMGLALVFPGAGHLYLGKWQRALSFCAIVLTSVVIGSSLEGKQFVAETVTNSPLQKLGVLASMASGIPYFVLRDLVAYEGDIFQQGYEYGTAFLLTAGLMNALLVLDAWDIGRGVKL